MIKASCVMYTAIKRTDHIVSPSYLPETKSPDLVLGELSRELQGSLGHYIIFCVRSYMRNRSQYTYDRTSQSDMLRVKGLLYLLHNEYECMMLYDSSLHLLPLALLKLKSSKGESSPEATAACFRAASGGR